MGRERYEIVERKKLIRKADKSLALRSILQEKPEKPHTYANG
jgi:hypothetical protein